MLLLSLSLLLSSLNINGDDFVDDTVDDIEGGDDDVDNDVNNNNTVNVKE